ncbi:MAG: hypothetical protein JWM11_2700, partial [Planctomycetaceae bacterium]|nr:hypothetical protein [Planctomycetaceae bacterium]
MAVDAPQQLGHHWEFLQFSIGIGLGNKLTRISNVSSDGKSIVFVGAADLSWLNGFVVRGTLDRNLILREFVLAAKTDDGSDATVKVQTSGERSPGGIPCIAQQGTVKSSTSRNGITVMSFADFDSTIVEAKILSDEEYLEKSSFEIPAAAVVVDSRKMAADPEKPNEEPAPRSRMRVGVFIGVNAFLLGIVA